MSLPAFIIAATVLAITPGPGIAYLVYLGVRLLLRKDQAFAVESVAPEGAHRALFEGIVVETLNVKTALFFLAFLPQFVSPSEPLVPQLVLLGSICVALNTLVDVIAVFAADRLLESGAARAARARVLTRASGATMLGLGDYLAMARRAAWICFRSSTSRLWPKVVCVERFPSIGAPTLQCSLHVLL